MEVERFRYKLGMSYVVQLDVGSSVSDEEWDERVFEPLKAVGAKSFGARSFSVPVGNADIDTISSSIESILQPKESAWILYLEGGEQRALFFAYPFEGDHNWLPA